MRAPAVVVGQARPRAAARAAAAAAAAPSPDPAADRADEVVELYRTLLGRPDADRGTSFVDLGGDSLSYVEISVRLGEVVGHLPVDWHQRTPEDLAQQVALAPTARRPRWRRVETNVVIRALAVLLILANHTKLADLPGGATRCWSSPASTSRGSG